MNLKNLGIYKNKVLIRCRIETDIGTLEID